MRPKGLVSMRLVERGDEDDEAEEASYDVLVEASKVKPAVKVKGKAAPRKRKPRPADVTCSASVTFKDDPDVSRFNFGKHQARDESGALVEQPPIAAGFKGGTVQPQSPEDKEGKQLRAKTESGKTLRKFKLNMSHAEYHMAGLARRPPHDRWG